MAHTAVAGGACKPSGSCPIAGLHAAQQTRNPHPRTPAGLSAAPQLDRSMAHDALCLPSSVRQESPTGARPCRFRPMSHHVPRHYGQRSGWRTTERGRRCHCQIADALRMQEHRQSAWPGGGTPLQSSMASAVAGQDGRASVPGSHPRGIRPPLPMTAPVQCGHEHG